MPNNKKAKLDNLYLKLDEALRDICDASDIIKGSGCLDSKIALIYESERHTNEALSVINSLNLCPLSIYSTCLYKFNLAVKKQRSLTRNPIYKEISEVCGPFLFEEIKIISPAICVTIGSGALKAVTGDKTIRLSELSGKPLEISGLIIFPIYNSKSSYYNDISGKYANDITNLKKIISYL